MQAAIASSSISPYMCRTSGPTSIVPECGDGIEAVVMGRIFPDPGRGRPEEASGPLDQDLERHVGRAARLDEVDREVEVDVVARRELRRVRGREPGPLELGGAPPLDSLYLSVLGCGADVCRRHVILLVPVSHYSAERAKGITQRE